MKTSTTIGANMMAQLLKKDDESKNDMVVTSKRWCFYASTIESWRTKRPP